MIKLTRDAALQLELYLENLRAARTNEDDEEPLSDPVDKFLDDLYHHVGTANSKVTRTHIPEMLLIEIAP